jgi:co-chaperonin GroES (HSP10)
MAAMAKSEAVDGYMHGPNKHVDVRVLPGGCKMVVRELKVDKTSGGIIIPDTNKDPRNTRNAVRCEVLALGEGKIHVCPDGRKVRVSVAEIIGQPIGIGSIVLCSRYWGDYEFDLPSGERLKLKLADAEEVLGVEVSAQQ